MQSALLREEFLLEDILLDEDIPDDEALLDEMIVLVDGALTPDLPKASEKKRKKTGKIIADILFYGVLAALVAVAFFISQGDKKPVFGYSFMNVITWSMEPEIPQGSLVIVKQVPKESIQIGDDITYTKDPETSVTHRVISITEDFENSGERGFETQGIANDTPDFDIVPAVNVVGVVQASVPLLGSGLAWLRNNLIMLAGFTIGIILLAVLLKGALMKSPVEANEKGKKPKESRKRRKKQTKRSNNLTPREDIR